MVLYLLHSCLSVGYWGKTCGCVLLCSSVAVYCSPPLPLSPPPPPLPFPLLPPPHPYSPSDKLYTEAFILIYPTFITLDELVIKFSHR